MEPRMNSHGMRGRLTHNPEDPQIPSWADDSLQAGVLGAQNDRGR